MWITIICFRYFDIFRARHFQKVTRGNRATNKIIEPSNQSNQGGGGETELLLCYPMEITVLLSTLIFGPALSDDSIYRRSVVERSSLMFLRAHSRSSRRFVGFASGKSLSLSLSRVWTALRVPWKAQKWLRDSSMSRLSELPGPVVRSADAKPYYSSR